MHDLYVVGIPTFVVLIGILLNQRGFERQDARMDKIEARLDKMQSDLTARIDRIQSDLSQFYRSLGEHEGKLDILMSDRQKPKA